MHRLLLGMIALALLVLTSSRAEDQPKETKAMKPGEMFQELVAKFRAAKTREDRDELLKGYAAKFIELAKKKANSDEALESLSYVLQLPLQGGKDSLKNEAIELLKKDYVKSPKVGKMLKRLQINAEDSETMAFVKSIMESNPDKASRAYAAKALIKANERMLRMADALNQNEELKERLEKAQGKNVVAKILENAKGAKKAIEEYQAKLAGELKGVLPDLSVGKAAPEVISEDLEGKKVKLSDYKGKVVVLDIWATWCGPCRAMIPHTRELVKKMEGKPFVFVSISADAKKETLTDFIKKTPMPWTHWYNGATGGIIEDWEVEYFPTIYVLDAKGIIRYKDVREKAMDEAVEKLVKEVEDAKKEKTE